MEIIDRILLITHSSVGFFSLILFWIPIFVRKGGDTHVKVGKAYQYSMWIVLITAVLLSLINLYQGRYIQAGFLSFLALITGYPLWYSIAALKFKKGPDPQMVRIRIGISYLLLVTSIGMIVWFVKINFDFPLLGIFGMLGLMSSSNYLLNKRRRQRSWIAEHIEGMLITGIAAHTAFFAFGGFRLFGHLINSQIWIIVIWMTPSVLGFSMIEWTKWRWRVRA